jgi:hypothetical protein
VASGLQIAQPQGLIQVGADVVDQFIKGVPAPAILQTPQIRRLLAEQLRLDQGGCHAVDLAIQAQAHRHPCPDGKAGIDGADQRMDGPRLRLAALKVHGVHPFKPLAGSPGEA